MTSVLLVTDAWHPQINGVVRTIERMIAELDRVGVRVDLLTPGDFRSIPCPTYPEIPLALTTPRTIAKRIEAARPDYIHIATEGPLGLLARRWCVKHRARFTTSYHTRFPEYLAARRLPVPLTLSYAFMRWFHGASSGTMVATDSLENELTARGFRRLMRWSRGVDLDRFRPDLEPVLDLPRPIFGYIGRVAVEKNIESFLDLELPGSKVVVGEGPALDDLRRRYPAVHFTGAKVGDDLARHFASLDVFMFPSLTDTFGMVLLEALASGVPVAAYPVMGPLDIVGASGVGALDHDLGKAAVAALGISREECRRHALKFTWEGCARQFLDNMKLAQAGRTAAVAIASEELKVAAE